MLTKKQQMFLIMLLKNRNGLRRDQQMIWQSKNFYRNTGYLIRAKFIESNIINDNSRQKTYLLKKAGFKCVQALLCLPDIKKAYPELYNEYSLNWKVFS
jgi:hypothetical protein